VTPDLTEAKVTVSGVPDTPGVAASLFRQLADSDVNVDMIVQNVSAGGVTDISFTVPHSDLDRAMVVCESVASTIGAAQVVADRNIAKISVIGAGMKSNPGVAATMFEVLASNGINIEMISTSAIRISCVIDQDSAEQAVGLLHAAFELEASDL
jgi:aspartate kinase